MNRYYAESMLVKAQENARAANMPELEQEVLQLLTRARALGGDPWQVLTDVEEALEAYSDSANSDLLYSLFARRAEANQMLGNDEEALASLHNALEILAEDATYQRTRIRATIASIHTARFEWEEASQVLEQGLSELGVGLGMAHVAEGGRNAALLNLVRANMLQALGKDNEASTLYEACTVAFEEADDKSFMVSALEGSITSACFLGLSTTRDTRARLDDYTRNAPEYRKVIDKQRRGIVNLAAENLAEARSELVEAIVSAQAIHNMRSKRGSRYWLAEVLLRASEVSGNDPSDALRQFVFAGDRSKSAEVAQRFGVSLSLGYEEFVTLIDELVEVSSEGDYPARGAALAALRDLSDFLPSTTILPLTVYLSRLDELPSSVMAERDLLKEAARLATVVMPLLDQDQALRVGEALVRATLRDLFWTSYKEVCYSLAVLAVEHPDVVGELDVPVERLVELFGGDVVDDRHNGMAALICLARAGHTGSRDKALEVLQDGNSVFHVNWRRMLGVATREELAEAMRAGLPQSINRVRELEAGGATFGIGAMSPMLFRDWEIPEEVSVEASKILAEAAADPNVIIPDRQAAAIVLGRRARDLSHEGRRRAIEALLRLLEAQDIETHSAVRSIDNPLSALRTNIGQPDDVKAAAAESLLALSHWMSSNERRRLMRKIEDLRASQVEQLGLCVSRGLQHFEPRGDEERWLATRLLLLLNASHAAVRQEAAYSMGDLIEKGAVNPDAELLNILLYMAYNEESVRDRAGAAYAIKKITRSAEWDEERANNAVEKLKEDRSYSVRKAIQPTQ